MRIEVVTVILASVVTWEIAFGTSNTGSHEVCDTEVINPQCPMGHVIVVMSARYGRMHKNRCITMNLGYMGCEADVQSQADRKCSGRESCQLRVPDSDFERVESACSPDLKKYLEIDYRCQRVVYPVDGDRSLPTGRCDGPTNLTDVSGFLSSDVASQFGCGSEDNPWIISALSGQAINLTLYDFSVEMNPSPYIITAVQGQHICYGYGLVHDVHIDEQKSICGGSARKSHVMVSTGNEVKVTFTIQTERYFLLEYNVLGCPDEEPTEDKWFKRQSLTSAQMGCEGNTFTWKLNCVDNKWSGKHQVNCSSAIAAGREDNATHGITYGVAMLIIVVSAVLVGCIIVLIGLIRFRGCPRQSEPYPPQSHYATNAALLPRHQDDYEMRCTCPVPPPHATIKRTPVPRTRGVALPETVSHNAHAHSRTHANRGHNVRDNRHYSLKANNNSSSESLGNDYEHIWQMETPAATVDATAQEITARPAGCIQPEVVSPTTREYMKYKNDNRVNDAKEKPNYVTSQDIYDENGYKVTPAKNSQGYSLLRKEKNNGPNLNRAIQEPIK